MDDLTQFMKEGSSGPADLDWLDVDETSYRQLDELPKQNLDVTPDLKALWEHQDRPATHFVPNTGAPKTMADMSQKHGPIRSKAPENLIRTARLAIMQSTEPSKIKHALDSRFDLTTLRANRTALATVMAERGLLGRYYIDASDFPTCAKGSKKASEFVRRFATEARFVRAKDACGDCIHRKSATADSSRCSVFHKEIVLEVPYSDELADVVEKSKGRGGDKTANSLDARSRIRAAHLNQGVVKATQFSGHRQATPKQIQGNTQENLIAVGNLTRKRDESQARKMAEIKARPVVATLRREMLKGRNRAELSQALKLAFDPRDLEATKEFWGPLYKEAGLFGVVYTTQDSFDDCRVGADFLAKHSSSTRAIVAGDKCGSCIFNKISTCMMYGKKLVASAEAVVTPETVAVVLDEHKIAGNLPYGAEKMSWGKTARESLKNIHDTATGPKRATIAQNLRATVEQGFYGGTRDASTKETTKQDILRVTAQYLNEGLYGDELLTLLRGRFLDNDLKAASSGLKGLLSEQGLQGIKYIDPSAYDDYGHGCKTAATRHRSRTAVQYAKIGSKCADCVHHTRPGHCSVLAKQLVVEPPYIDKVKEQQAVLASGQATEVSYESLMNNGLSMMAEYELQNGDGAINLSPERSVVDVAIEFGIQDVKL